jgi:undecaprenyl diphosphate synthase
LEALNETLRAKIVHAMEMTRHNTRLTLCIAFNYGGRDEIVCAVRNMIHDGVQPADVTEEMIGRYLFTAGVPDPDLIVRTSGEMRISNFLIWQAAYAEWYVTPTYWPDFDKDELYKALEVYCRRDRRYGRLSDSQCNC